MCNQDATHNNVIHSPIYTFLGKHLQNCEKWPLALSYLSTDRQDNSAPNGQIFMKFYILLLLFLNENQGVCEIMRKNMGEPDRPQILE